MLTDKQEKTLEDWKSHKFVRLKDLREALNARDNH
jgi:hypothetical protein